MYVCVSFAFMFIFFLIRKIVAQHTIKRTLDCVTLFIAHNILCTHPIVRLLKGYFQFSFTSQAKREKKATKRKHWPQYSVRANIFRWQLIILKRGKYTFIHLLTHINKDLIFSWTIRSFLPIFLHLVFCEDRKELLNDEFEDDRLMYRASLWRYFKCSFLHTYTTCWYKCQRFCT